MMIAHAQGNGHRAGWLAVCMLAVGGIGSASFSATAPAAGKPATAGTATATTAKAAEPAWFKDSFKDKDGTTLAAHDKIWAGKGAASDFVIQSNTVQGGSGRDGAYWNGSYPSQDYDVQADFISDTSEDGDNMALFARASSSDLDSGLVKDGYVLSWGHRYLQLTKTVHGNVAFLGACQLRELPLPLTIRLSCNGSTITVYVNSVQKIAVKDTTFASGVGGIASFDGDPLITFRNFGIGPVGFAY